jgi:hypothetical protein
MPPPSSACNDVANWLTTDFIGSFQNDADPALWTANAQHQHYRGFFSISLLTLAYCEAMSAFMLGKAKSKSPETVAFLETEVGPRAGSPAATTRYRERSALLFFLYRHGIAHQREPGRLDVDGSHILWWTSRGAPLTDHLKFTLLRPGVYRLAIDVDLLYSHALAAFNDIRDRARVTPALALALYNGLVDADSARPPLTRDATVWARMRGVLAGPVDP